MTVAQLRALLAALPADTEVEDLRLPGGARVHVARPVQPEPPKPAGPVSSMGVWSKSGRA